MDFSFSHTQTQPEQEDYNAFPSLTIWPTTKSTIFRARTLCLDKGPVLIGRTDGLGKLGNDTDPSDSNGIFEDATVSRHHATISFKDGHFWITDNNSTHGTLLNNDKLRSEPYMLKNKDILTFGAAPWHDGIEFKGVVGRINLHFPSYDTIVPSSVDENFGNTQPDSKEVESSRNKNEEKVDGGFGGDTEDTQTMDELIGELESSRSPRAKRKLEGVLEAQKYKAELGITTKQAVAKVQKLAEF